MTLDEKQMKGRGAGGNPANRFERYHYEGEGDEVPEDSTRPQTHFFKDATRTILAHNDSPDVGFSTSINPYRGCEHGCIYCYARPTHEYVGFSAGLDFETKILVKENAPELLRRELTAPKWIPEVISISGVTDPYQPVERRLQITRRCLEVLAEFRNPVVIVTKNHLVTRDTDILSELAKHQAAAVFISVTSLDADLSRVLEPRASTPISRLAVLEALEKAGVPTGVMVAPVIPGLTDHELPAIIEAAARVGTRYAGFVPLRLPLAVAPLFQKWLADHFPEKKDRVLSRVRHIRRGKLNDSKFGRRMRGEGEFAEMFAQMFHLACKKSGLNPGGPKLSTSVFRRPGEQQLLF